MSEHNLAIPDELCASRTGAGERCGGAADALPRSGVREPQLVKRGETSPRIKKQSHPPRQTAHIDWLAFTLTPMPEVSDEPIPWLMAHLAHAFGLPDISINSTGKGWTGYTHRFNIGEHGEYGLIALGGEKQRGTIHVELNATACAHVPDWHTVQQWGETNDAKITRVDLAHDDMNGEAVNIKIAKAWYKTGEFTTNGRPPKPRLIDDLDSGEGKTFYIGKREHGKLLRIYEKGRQLGDPSSLWVRVELELHDKSRVLPWDVLTSPATYLAAGYPCLAYLSAVQDKIRTISKSVEITLESMQRYLRMAGGKSINALMQAGGENAEVLITAIRRDGIPRRLVNYADFLPQVFAGDVT